MKNQIQIQPKLEKAINDNKPVVGLETTVLSFGLPFPDNLHTFNAMQQAILEQDVLPAVTYLKDGKVCIGMENQTLDQFVQPSHEMLKVNRSNFSYCLTKKATGATTVSATMMCCEMADIKIIATGGIGGVHRNFDESHDISADLLELAQTPCIVVCSGVKSILDLPKTLEFLETYGVPIIGYQTDMLPAFHSASSSYRLDQTIHSVEEIAEIAKTHWSLKSSQKTGILVVNPIPTEDEIPFDQVNIWVEQALSLAKEQNVKGKNVTPFLLDQLNHLSNGKSLKANKSLLINNAKLAAKISSFYKK